MTMRNAMWKAHASDAVSFCSCVTASGFEWMYRRACTNIFLIRQRRSGVELTRLIEAVPRISKPL